jgi:predicted acetyltransferase
MVEIRTTQPDEYRQAARAMGSALLFAAQNDEAWATSLPSWDEMDSVSAWDGARCVGHAGAFIVDTVVPGGARLATSAVTRVGVLSTHRRQGVATGLMTQLLRDGRDAGRPLASLRASEAVIYGRYGFGVAGEANEVTVDPIRARPLRGGADGSMRLLASDEVLDVVQPVYDRWIGTPGMITRTPSMWRRYFRGAVSPGDHAELVAVHAGPDGADDGYVHYRVKWQEVEHSASRGVGEVIELVGASTAVELALWRYVCELDLVRRWTAIERPVDDAVRLAVADRRAYEVRLTWDEQWLRLLDVDAALGARTYGDAVDGVTIAVRDDLFPDNTGVWRIEPKGATRHEADPDSADLAADVAMLAAAYLGGTRWALLADVDLVTERTPGALALADALFATPRAPFCGSFL